VCNTFGNKDVYVGVASWSAHHARLGIQESVWEHDISTVPSNHNDIRSNRIIELQNKS